MTWLSRSYTTIAQSLPGAGCALGGNGTPPFALIALMSGVFFAPFWSILSGTFGVLAPTKYTGTENELVLMYGYVPLWLIFVATVVATLPAIADEFGSSVGVAGTGAFHGPVGPK